MCSIVMKPQKITKKFLSLSHCRKLYYIINCKHIIKYNIEFDFFYKIDIITDFF